MRGDRHVRTGVGLHEFLFLSRLSTIPLGIAVALEFAGPLGVGDGGFAPRHRFPVDIDGGARLAGVAAARVRVAAVWTRGGRYTGWPPAFSGRCTSIFGRKAGAAHGGQTTALGMVIGAVVIVPIGVAAGRSASVLPAILPAALGVALLSSALPYSLEMLAMPRLADPHRGRAHELGSGARRPVGTRVF